MRVGLVFSAEMEAHAGPPNHPECPARHERVVARFKESGLMARCVHIAPRPATDEELLRAHSQAHLEHLASLWVADGTAVQTAGDLYWCESTHAAARLSAGCAVEATLSVVRGQLSSAFAVIRPPGHHAECERAMGFCYLNNASVACLAALQEPNVDRVLILDWDVHHGNGIESIHYDDPRVLYISLHRYSTDPGSWFYPGTGAKDDVGAGAGTGFNVNIPWHERGGGDADYLAAFELLVCPIVTAFAPSLILISAGYDAAQGDPLGAMNLSPDGYRAMTDRLVCLQAQGKVVVLLEGGYNLYSTAHSAEATLRALLREEAPAGGGGRAQPRPSTADVLRAVLAVQRRHWGEALLGSDPDAFFAALHVAALRVAESPRKTPPRLAKAAAQGA